LLTIIASMERELAGLRKKTRAYQTAGISSRFALKVVGIGGAQAGQSVASLAGRRLSEVTHSGGTLPEAEQGILLLGFAGGVDPSLAPGALTISTSYKQSASGNSLHPDPGMWRRAVQAATSAGLLFDQGDSLTVDRPIATVLDKDALFRRYRVGTVNMEDYAIAVAARDAGVPFLAVRAVLDPADQSLPAYVLAMSRSQVKAVLGTAFRPWRIAPMLRLSRQMRLAQNSLTGFALAYLQRSQEEEQQEGSGAPQSQAALGRQAGNG
jgi:hypothetical protein